jgi:hypothetical protein
MVSGAMASAEVLEVDLTKIPPAAAHEVDFEKDVKPLLEASCVKCHSGPRPKHGFSMETKEAFLKGGRSENPGMVVGKSAESLIIQTMSRASLSSGSWRNCIPNNAGRNHTKIPLLNCPDLQTKHSRITEQERLKKSTPIVYEFAHHRQV